MLLLSEADEASIIEASVAVSSPASIGGAGRAAVVVKDANKTSAVALVNMGQVKKVHVQCICPLCYMRKQHD